jgi:hypothetical protein
MKPRRASYVAAIKATRAGDPYRHVYAKPAGILHLDSTACDHRQPGPEGAPCLRPPEDPIHLPPHPGPASAA